MGSAKARSATAARRAEREERDRALREQALRERQRRNKLLTVMVCAVIFAVLAGATGYFLFTVKSDGPLEQGEPSRSAATTVVVDRLPGHCPPATAGGC